MIVIVILLTYQLSESIILLSISLLILLLTITLSCCCILMQCRIALRRKLLLADNIDELCQVDKVVVVCIGRCLMRSEHFDHVVIVMIIVEAEITEELFYNYLVRGLIPINDHYFRILQ